MDGANVVAIVVMAGSIVSGGGHAHHLDRVVGLACRWVDNVFSTFAVQCPLRHGAEPALQPTLREI